MIGQKLGNYEIVDKLGEGGMGEVWRGRDLRLNRPVAIKTLPPALAADPMLRARFEQEARALAALNHPNIVTIHDIGQDDGGRAFMVSELVDGESLRAVLERGPLPLRKAVDYAVQMADGMAAAHTLGIVHRDLKPENVMVTRSGQVKLLDFGLAKQNTLPSAGDRTATLALSQPGTVMGTVGYMSPEQVRGEAVDARSDIFSFGTVLYEMLSGRRAFQSATAVETMTAILNNDPPEFDPNAAAVPPALATTIRRCLEKRPEQRFQSAADLAFALRSMSTITTPSGAVSAAKTAPQRSPRRTLLWLGGAAAALALVGAGYLLKARTSHTEPARFERLTFRKGFVGNARFVPGTRNVIFSASFEGKPSRVYLSVPGSPEARDLGVPDGCQLLAVSSKDELAFSTPNGELERMSISGGQMRPLFKDVEDADFGPDGTSLAVLRSANGVRRIEYPIGTVLVDNLRFALPAIRVSPDGSRVAYFSFKDGRRILLNIVDRGGKSQAIGLISGQTITNEVSPISWSPSGDEIWFRSYDPGDSQTIYAVNLKGQRRVVANLPGRAGLYDLSQGRALVGTATFQFGIVGTAPGESEERDLSCLDQALLMGITDDGKTILASVLGDGGGSRGSMYLRKTDGSLPVRLGDGIAFKLAPDGSSVSGYLIQPDGSRRFGVFPTGAGEETTTPASLEFAAVYGWLGPRTYLLMGANKGGKRRCLTWNSGDGSLKPVCPEGLADTYIVYLSPDRNRLLTIGPSNELTIYALNGGPEQKVLGIQPSEEPIGWSADNRSLYVTRNRVESMTAPVWLVDPASGRRKLWKEIRVSKPMDSPGDFHLKITPDGRAYAYNYSTLRSDLYVATGLK